MTLHSYPKVFNLGHPQIKELFEGTVLVEEKVDGSQFSFGIINGVLCARSKGQEINIDAPEKMFATAIEMIKTLNLRPEWTYRGEYLQKPKHNTLCYERTPRKNIILFDINTGLETYMSRDAKEEEAERIGLEIVPVLYQGVIKEPAELFNLLDTTSILGGVKVEGIVIKNYAKFGNDKKVLMGKYVSEAFKEKHGKEWRKANPTSGDIIQELILIYKTEARWQKAIQHLKESGNITDTPKDIGSLIKEIQRDFIEECSAEIKERLYKYAIDKIARGLISGVPEWYKNILADKQFEKDGE